jgi:hypothetical protein
MRVFQAVIAVTTELDLPCPLLAGAGQRSQVRSLRLRSRGLGFEKRQPIPPSAGCRRSPGRCGPYSTGRSRREGRR